MSNKKFDYSLYEKYDQLGKEAVSKYLKKYNLVCKENPKSSYDVDLYIYKDDKLVAYGEVEVRKSWKTETFPYKTLHIPFRKNKYLYNKIPTFYFSLNEKCSTVLVISDTNIFSSNIVKSSNMYRKDEDFFDVPIEKISQDFI